MCRPSPDGRACFNFQTRLALTRPTLTQPALFIPVLGIAVPQISQILIDLIVRLDVGLTSRPLAGRLCKSAH